MKLTEEALKGIERLALEGRVSERGQPVVRLVAEAPPFEAKLVSEKQFQAAVVQEAVRNGWLPYHTYLSVRSKKGFPDLVLIRERVIYVELKVGENELTATQLQFRDALLAAGQEWYCWRPESWGQVVEVLGRKP